jgi:hypothetical protein
MLAEAGSSPFTSFIQQFDELNVSRPAGAMEPPVETVETEIIEPLTFRLNQFRLSAIGCDVSFVVGGEKKVRYPQFE